MKKRNVAFSVFVLTVFLFIFIVKRWKEPVVKEAFDRHPSHLVYTKHALCRMACRSISEGEIQEILDRGSINFNRSRKMDRPCPTFALQGRTANGKNMRIIFAQCNNETRVVTCYNLEKDFSCNCPGDERKN